MKEQHKDLAQAIHMQNEFNRIASQILEYVKDESKAFIGKKITTLTGVTEKFKATIKPPKEHYIIKSLPGGNYAYVHRIIVSEPGMVDICLIFDTPTNIGCIYKSNQYYYGKVSDGVLTEVNDLTINTDLIYYESELMKIEELRRLETQIYAIKKMIRVDESAYKSI